MNRFLIPLALAAILTSCTFEEKSIGDNPSGNTVLQASLESVEGVRTALNENDEVVWSDGDAISVVGTSSTTFSLSAGSGTTVGRFTGDITSAGSAPYFAIFPKTGNASLTGGMLTFDIAKSRDAVEGNVKSDALPMVSAVDGESLQFRNLFGLLKITLSSKKSIAIRKMTLHDLGGNMLWGKCSIPVKSGVPAYGEMSLTGGDNTTSILFENGISISPTKKSFYFCVPPGTLDRGFSIVLYEYDSSADDNAGKAYSFLQKISSPVAAERSVIINIDAAAISEKSEPLDSKERGYYKTLFVDGSLGLTHFVDTDTLPWIKAMGLENDYECISVSNTKERDSLTALGIMRAAPLGQDATWQDDNGVLLYPDGKPRFRTMYVNGGNSSRHGKFLSQEGRDRINTFYNKGGSYVASCAGAFLAAKYVDGKNCYNNADEDENFTYGLFPGNLVHTSLPVSISKYGAVFTAIKALTDFGDFAAGDTLDLVYHHGGGYLPYAYNYQLSPQPERLFSYQYTGDPKAATDTTLYTYYNLMHYANFGKIKNKVDSTCIWAYKKSSTSGMAVLCGSHPEDNVSPSQIALMCNMIDYSLDGAGATTLKATLELGAERVMNASWADDKPTFAKIGDRQYHHFKLVATQPIQNFRLTLDSDYADNSGIDLYLSMRKGGAAWLSDADYVLCNKGGKKELNIKNLPAGTWYIGVYCATTVTATRKDPTSYLKFFSYTGKTETLNGIAYSIKAESTGGSGTKMGVDVTDSPDSGKLDD